jgi:16S rRNA (uracil1498-N3)-methyltransferase
LTSNHFFVPNSGFEGDTAVLRGAESHHLGRVLRAKAGEEVWIFDEEGARFRARIETLTREEAVLRIVEREASPGCPTRITLAQSLLKPKAMDWLVRKAAELGAATIVPIKTARVVSRPAEAEGGRKSERWSRIALEASKQSRSGRPPAIEAPKALSDFLTECRAAVKIVLSEHGGRRLGDLVIEAERREGGRPPAEAALLVGPEGGWTEEEEEASIRNGFSAGILGPRILRAETAALAALAIIGHAWNG